MAETWQLATLTPLPRDLAPQSLRAFFPDESYAWWGADDWFVTEQHPRGFARLVDAMVADTLPDGDERLVLNAEVTRVECAGLRARTPGRVARGGRRRRHPYAPRPPRVGAGTAARASRCAPATGAPSERAR
jgi:hypothetical protein